MLYTIYTKLLEAMLDWECGQDGGPSKVLETLFKKSPLLSHTGHVEGDLPGDSHLTTTRAWHPEREAKPLGFVGSEKSREPL